MDQVGGNSQVPLFAIIASLYLLVLLWDLANLTQHCRRALRGGTGGQVWMGWVAVFFIPFLVLVAALDSNGHLPAWPSVAVVSVVGIPAQFSLWVLIGLAFGRVARSTCDLPSGDS
jgi:hypothetical protein